MPFGWFCVGYPEDFPAGEPKALFYFDRHLVAWRDEPGELHVQDAFCPHLGAHLGHGGTVEGCEIVCPFHGWQFDAEGANTDIPYRERTNKKGTLRTYPVVERNGLVARLVPPRRRRSRRMWEIARAARVQRRPRVVHGHPHGAHRRRRRGRRWPRTASTPPTSATCTTPPRCPEIESYETGVPRRRRCGRSQKFPTPRGVIEGRIDSRADGARAVAVVRFSGIVDTLSLAVTTPITAEQCITRFNFRFKTMGDEETTRNVGQAFVREVDKQFLEDKPIWEHKAHLVRPALADNDGPFMKFRKWAAQFYAEGVSDERTVFPPPWWPDRADEAPAKATASAKHGDD